MEFVDTNTTLRNVGQKIRGAPMITLRRAMIQACRDFCAETHWLRDTVVMDTTTSSGIEGDYEITLDDPTLLEVVAIRNDMQVLDPDTNKHVRAYPEPDPACWNPDVTAGTPRWYAYVPEGMFKLYPPPDKTFGLTITCVVQPKDDVPRLPRDLFKKHQKVLDAGALAYLYAIDKQAWTSQREAERQQTIFQAGINNAKADAQRNYATGSQRAKPRRFTRL